MRRLVVELYGKELEGRILANNSFNKLRSLEMVHILRNDQTENAAIWRIRLKDPEGSIEDCFKDDVFTTELQVLEREDNRDGADPSYLVLMRRKTRPGLLLGFGNKPGGGYMLGPMGYNEGRLKFTFAGTQKQIKDILKGAEKRKIRYRIISMTDADFAEDSLLHRLTDKQRNILILAYKLGYFDVPKKINSDQLGARLHLTGSTVVEHLGKAERRLIASIIDEA
jgi:DNA-binding CsgD family transcriptional regulator